MADSNTKTILRRTQFIHAKMGDVGGFEDYITLDEAQAELPQVESFEKGKLYRDSKSLAPNIRMNTMMRVKP
jgi:hypothetical protein